MSGCFGGGSVRQSGVSLATGVGRRHVDRSQRSMQQASLTVAGYVSLQTLMLLAVITLLSSLSGSTARRYDVAGRSPVTGLTSRYATGRDVASRPTDGEGRPIANSPPVSRPVEAVERVDIPARSRVRALRRHTHRRAQHAVPVAGAERMAREQRATLVRNQTGDVLCRPGTSFQVGSSLDYRCSQQGWEINVCDMSTGEGIELVEHASPSSMSSTVKTLRLSVKAREGGNFPCVGGEVKSENVFVGPVMYRARVIPGGISGSLSSVFMISPYTSDWQQQEIDIEFLGNRPHGVQINLHNTDHRTNPPAAHAGYTHGYQHRIDLRDYGINLRDGQFHQFEIWLIPNSRPGSADGTILWRVDERSIFCLTDDANIPNLPLEARANAWRVDPHLSWAEEFQGELPHDFVASTTQYRDMFAGPLNDTHLRDFPGMAICDRTRTATMSRLEPPEPMNAPISGGRLTARIVGGTVAGLGSVIAMGAAIWCMVERSRTPGRSADESESRRLQNDSGMYREMEVCSSDGDFGLNQGTAMSPDEPDSG